MIGIKVNLILLSSLYPKSSFVNIGVHHDMNENTDDAHDPDGFSLRVYDIFDYQKSNNGKWGDNGVK
jgi:hypothetical protein